MSGSIASPGFHLPIPSDHALEPAARAASCASDLTTLVHTYSSLLFRVAYSILRSTSEAEDVVQEVFLKVLEKQSDLPQIRDPRIWLTRIAWNLALDRRRRIRPDQMDERFARDLTARDTPADQSLTAAARVVVVLAEINRLPRREREIILLAASEELSTTDLAAVMQCTESAARALLFRARTRLRVRLERREAEPASTLERRSHP